MATEDDAGIEARVAALEDRTMHLESANRQLLGLLGFLTDVAAERVRALDESFAATS